MCWLSIKFEVVIIFRMEGENVKDVYVVNVNDGIPDYEDVVLSPKPAAFNTDDEDETISLPHDEETKKRLSRRKRLVRPKQRGLCQPKSPETEVFFMKILFHFKL